MTRASAVSAARSGELLDVLLAERERFVSFLARRVGDRATAEDLLHSAFAKVLERGATPRDPSRVVPWFFRLLRRGLIDHARRTDAGRRALERRGRLDAPAERRLHEAVCACVTELLPTLPPEHRDLLRRVEIEGETVREAASKLGITPNLAAVRAHRARATLARRLRDLCGACAAHRCLRCRCDASRAGPRRTA